MSETAASGETGLLVRYLDQQREHVLGILEGLDSAALRRPVLPSGWTCLGLVQHLTIDVERLWFRGVVAAEELDLENGGKSAWKVGAEVPAAEVLESYRREWRRANEIIAATPLDAPPGYWPEEMFGSFRMHSLRQIILHVIAETACHAGHLDAARELTDGQTWMVLD
jgi:hypothetical protein